MLVKCCYCQKEDEIQDSEFLRLSKKIIIIFVQKHVCRYQR